MLNWMPGVESVYAPAATTSAIIAKQKGTRGAERTGERDAAGRGQRARGRDLDLHARDVVLQAARAGIREGVRLVQREDLRWRPRCASARTLARSQIRGEGRTAEEVLARRQVRDRDAVLAMRRAARLRQRRSLEETGREEGGGGTDMRRSTAQLPE